MLEVQAPLGTVIGTIEQQWTLWKPNFAIKDANGETLLTIDGPCCPCACCSDVMFEVKSADRSTNVGQITKQWSGMIKEMFTDTDNFGISFPMDLNVKAKATLLGACFLIDFMFFEQNQN
ncbi:hypothetical protein QZH41_001804 [Actinostola sp. cb2023]|nr:hypothetical protein QZH41_001804 [Actinostola sp. cb2023]